MSKELQQNIISQVKAELKIVDDITDQSLFQLLCKALKESHPDRYSNEDAKHIATERFKKLNDLRSALGAYIEQKHANQMLAKIDNPDNIDVVIAINENANKDEKIFELEKENKHLNSLYRFAQQEIENLKKKHIEYITSSQEKKRDSLTDIYKPKTKDNIIGITSVVAILSILIPQVQEILLLMNTGGIVLSCIVFSMAIIWMFAIIRNWLIQNVINNIIDNILYSRFSRFELDINTPKEKYKGSYFTENSIVRIVERHLSNGFIKLLIFGKRPQIRRLIVEYIILEYERKGIITSSDVQNLTRRFYCNYSENLDKEDEILQF